MSPAFRSHFVVCAPIVAALSFAAIGCKIPLGDAPSEQNNTCSTSDDCGADSVCALVSEDSLCISTKADLAGIHMEVRPAVNSVFGANTSFLLDFNVLGVGLQTTEINGPIELNPTLPALVSIAPGKVSCTADKSSIAAKVEFRRVPTFVGLPEKTYSADPEPDTSDTTTSPSFAFHIDVPPGLYDVYLQPEASTTCGGAPMPPVFIPSMSIAMDTIFRVGVKPARHLTGKIQVPVGTSLDKWEIEVKDINSGRLISETQVIEHLDASKPAEIDLYYNLTQGVSPYVRLHPPTNTEKPVAAPNMFWDLAALDLQGLDVISLSLPNLNVPPRQVEGHVRDVNQTPVLAEVTLQSTGLDGGVPKNAVYKVIVETEKDGLFKAEVPPGNYEVKARPLNDLDNKSLAIEQWEIHDVEGCFCGRVVTIHDKAVLKGQVLTPTQGPLLAAAVVGAPAFPPSFKQPVSQLDRDLLRVPFQPRDATGSVKNGDLSLAVDLGSYDFFYDFSVQTPAESGYPWLVRSRLTVGSTAEDEQSSIGEVTVAHPVVVTGTIRDPFGTVVSDATVKVWLPVKDSSGSTNSALQIAETSTDSAGRYTLLLPPSISQ